MIRLGVALAQLSTSCNVSTAAHRESGAAGTH
ncbi:putative lipoprotein [Burkholderia pseudomallei]|nr:putative lipoprotein [Burkholderia pseudomallei]